VQWFLANVTFKALAAIWRRHADMQRVKYTRNYTDTIKMWSASRWTSDMENKFNKCIVCAATDGIICCELTYT